MLRKPLPSPVISPTLAAPAARVAPAVLPDILPDPVHADRLSVSAAAWLALHEELFEAYDRIIAVQGELIDAHTLLERQKTSRNEVQTTVVQ